MFPAIALIFAIQTAYAANTCDDYLMRVGNVDPAAARRIQDAHGAIEHDLYTGRVTLIRPFSQDGNNHGLYIVTLEANDPFTGELRVREAIFKPRVYGDEDGWSRTPMEYVAYFLNRKLGMDYVPPVTYRKFLSLSVNGQTFTEGAFLYKVPGFRSLHSLPHAHFPAQNEAVVSDNRILNVLLQNQDGHSKNLGEGIHWVDGKTRPVFIDFGASGRAGTNVSMTHYPAYENSEPVKKIRRETYENLKALRHDMFHGIINDGMMSDGEVWALLGRRDGIIRYFDDLISRLGPDQVFLP